MAPYNIKQRGKSRYIYYLYTVTAKKNKNIVKDVFLYQDPFCPESEYFSLMNSYFCAFYIKICIMCLEVNDVLIFP